MRKRDTPRRESQAGTVTVRMPAALHQAVVREAAHRRTSINTLAVEAIRRSLSSTEWMARGPSDGDGKRYKLWIVREGLRKYHGSYALERLLRVLASLPGGARAEIQTVAVIKEPPK